MDRILYLIGGLLILAGGLAIGYVAVGWGAIIALVGIDVIALGGWLRWRRELRRDD